MPAGHADKSSAYWQEEIPFIRASTCPVSVAAMPTATLTLEVNGATLRVESGVDEVLLRTVLNALRVG
jgi:hypothetical protein